MADITKILKRAFLEFLESDLTKLCRGQVSIVFEDLQSLPICQRYPRRRVFACRKKGNVCKCMIDCSQNEKAQLKCLLSDVEGATISRVKQKGYFYRCHRGKGFPNFLFPIVIWENEVVGYVYVGQFVFKKLGKKERTKFSKRLEELKNSQRYVIEDVERFISGWSDPELHDFYDYIVEEENVKKQFTYERFSELINGQVRDYGLSQEEFFNIIEFTEGLAEYLSTLGNALYTLQYFVEIEQRLSPRLNAKYVHDIQRLRVDIMSLVAEETKHDVNVQEAVRKISEKSLEILTDCKEYEDKCVSELIRPYKLGIMKQKEQTQQLILEFYLRHASFAIALYSKIRALRGTHEGDQLVLSSFENLAGCGLQFDSLRETIKDTFLRLYQDQNVKVLLKTKLVQCLRVLFENDSNDLQLSKWLTDNGITDLRIEEYGGIVSCFPKTFDSTVRDFESLSGSLTKTNRSLTNEINGDARMKLADIGDMIEYVRAADQLRVKLSEEFSKDKFGTRECLDLRAYEVWLNSGGLNAVHRNVLNAQQEWIAQRNEEGPIGSTLEQELERKVEETRSGISRLVSAETPDCIVFTSNTTTSIDMVLRAVLKPKDEVLMTDLEHDVVNNEKDWFHKHLDVKFTTVPVSQYLLKGRNWISSFLEKITEKTRVIIITHITFSTGSILPVKDIVKKCQKFNKSGRKIFILVDGAHAVGNVKVNVKEIGCDFYAFDGHKWLLGPEGTGILYTKEEYLKADNPFGVHFLLSTAYMVSPKYAPKKDGGEKYELGTADGSKIIGLGAAIQEASRLDYDKTAKHRILLTEKLGKALENTEWRILNSNSAPITGMICLQIVGHEQDPKIYQDIVAALDKSNVKVRSLKNPSCIRLCLHHTNNETDVEIAAFHLKALLEGVNVHRGNPDRIKVRIKQIIQQIIKPVNPNDRSGKIGLSIYSIGGSGKTTVITEIISELMKSGDLKSRFICRAKDILNDPKSLAVVFNGAWKKGNQPALIFFDEADSLLTEENKTILGMFNDEQRIILKKRREEGITPIVFVTAENDPYKIAESAARRLYLAYFPLPDFEARLKYLNKLAVSNPQKRCSSKLLLTQIAGITDGYSMSNLEDFWNDAVMTAESDELTPENFLRTFKNFRGVPQDRNLLSKYNDWLEDLKPIRFTGTVDAFLGS